MAPLLQSPKSDPGEELVLRHRRLARHLARRYARTGEQREDLEQVACLGLVKAARRFDPDRGIAFTSFATPTILGELRRFCRDTRWSAHVPRPVQEQVQALRHVEDDYQLRHGRSPSAAEAAGALGWSEEDVLDARLAAGSLRPQSLNATLRSPDGTVGEVIECIGEEDRGFAATERRDELQRALARLSSRERRALRLRGEAGCAIPEIASRMGLSPSQASRLVVRATQRLREALDGEQPAAGREPPYVRLAEADPALFAGVEPPPGPAAVARCLTVPAGRWRGPQGHREGLGLLVLEGALLRAVTVAGKRHAELIGPGDVVRRCDGEPAASWRVVQTARLAVLGDSLCRWPSVVDALLRRASERSHALAMQLAIADLRRAEDRVLGLFRTLAERWGQRQGDGLLITVPLTHDMIAMLVGAHRPTVTSALGRLEEEGRLHRCGRDRWQLTDARRPPALAA